MPRKKIDESRVERIAKQIVGMGTFNSDVTYDTSIVSSAVNQYLDTIYAYYSSLNFVGIPLPLNPENPFESSIPDLDITQGYWEEREVVIDDSDDHADDGEDKQDGTNSKTENVLVTEENICTIKLECKIEYFAYGNLTVTDGGILRAKEKDYNGILKVKLTPKLRIDGEMNEDTYTPDDFMLIKFEKGNDNVITNKTRKCREGWINCVDELIKKVYKRNRRFHKEKKK